MFCSNCGNEIPDDASVCSICGYPTDDGAGQEAYYQPQPEQQYQPQPEQQYQPQGQQYQQYYTPVAPPTNKPRSAYIAALLHLFLGAFGFGYFYRGMSDKGKNCWIMLLVGALTSIIGVGLILLIVLEIINFVEAIKLFGGKITKDAYGRDLYQEF